MKKFIGLIVLFSGLLFGLWMRFSSEPEKAVANPEKPVAGQSLRAQLSQEFDGQRKEVWSEDG